MWCMGGSVRGVITGERMRDTDLFFGSEDAYKEFERRMLARDDVICTHYPGSSRIGTDVPYIHVKRKSDGHCYDPCNWFYGPLDEHIDNSDWLHTSAACDMYGNAMIRQDVMDSIERKVLIRGKCKLSPNLKLARLFRFLDEGWTCDPATYDEVVRLVRDQEKVDLGAVEICSEFNNLKSL